MSWCKSVLRVRILIVLCALGIAAFVFLNERLYGPMPAHSGRFAVDHKTIEVAGPQASVAVHLWYPVDASGHLPDAGENLKFVLFQAGWGEKAANHSLRLTDLASNGYVVAGFDDILHDRSWHAGGVDRDATEAIETNWDISSELASKRTAKAGDLRVRLMAKRASTVLSALQSKLRSDPFWQRVDVDRVGFLGFSLGGAVAVEAAMTDSRIKAAINLDGSLYGDTASKGPMVPYLFIASDSPPGDPNSPSIFEQQIAMWWARDIAMHRSFRTRSDFRWLEAKSTYHADFTDELFNPSVRDRLKRSWRWRVALFRSTNAAIMRFMHLHIKGRGEFAHDYGGEGVLMPFER